jgi:predicted transposase YdaD
MAEQLYDKSSKWLLEHHGRAVALLGGLREVLSCKAVQAEVVQPRQLPDGLLEVRLAGRREPVLLLVEICTYPEKRVPRQVSDDLMMVRMNRGVLPDVLTLVLCPRGKLEVPDRQAEQSALGWSQTSFGWKVVPLWTLAAEELLGCADVGVVPWVPLTQFPGSPQTLLQRCRERIDREGGEQRANLLAVTQVLTRLRFPQRELLDLFGGCRAMIESPLIKEIVENTDRKRQRAMIEAAIQVRFGALPEAARASLEGLKEEATLDALHRFAIVCPSLEAFLERLARETTAPPRPTSSRRPRKR